MMQQQDSASRAAYSIPVQELARRIGADAPDCYAALLRELSGIGTIINQLAHWANGKGYAKQAEIHSAAVLAKQAWQLVKDTL